MATFKAVIRKNQTNQKGLSNIKILVVQNGKTVHLKTEHYVEPSLMGKNGKVKPKHPNADYLNRALALKIFEYEERLLKINKAVRLMNVQQVRDYLEKSNTEGIDFLGFAKQKLDKIKGSNTGTYEIYNLAVEQFKKYLGLEFLPFRDLNKTLLEKFESHCREKGRSTNTISVYMRAIRSIFNDAIEELNKEGFDPVISNYPFRFYKIKSEPTRKRNLTIEVIKTIRDKEFSDRYQNIARDMFMLTFYLVGINMKDLFYLRKITKGRIDYARAKTGTKISIKVEPEAMAIIDRYKGEKYLLKFADNCREERDPLVVRKKHQRFGYQYLDHKAFNKMVNDKLKDIAKDLELTEKISTYWARHSWATIARNDCKISKDDISLCLGHKDPSKKVVDIYLNEDLGIIDNSNRMVLDRILHQVVQKSIQLLNQSF